VLRHLYNTHAKSKFGKYFVYSVTVMPLLTLAGSGSIRVIWTPSSIFA